MRRAHRAIQNQSEQDDYRIKLHRAVKRGEITQHDFHHALHHSPQHDQFTYGHESAKHHRHHEHSPDTHASVTHKEWCDAYQTHTAYRARFCNCNPEVVVRGRVIDDKNTGKVNYVGFLNPRTVCNR